MAALGFWVEIEGSEVGIAVGEAGRDQIQARFVLLRSRRLSMLRADFARRRVREEMPRV